jgi:hypothetical protein
MDPPEDGIGLCATCQYRRTIPAARSTFYLCERSFTDPRFPRYPPLPVVGCNGYSVAEPAPGDTPETR